MQKIEGDLTEIITEVMIIIMETNTVETNICNPREPKWRSFFFLSLNCNLLDLKKYLITTLKLSKINSNTMFKNKFPFLYYFVSSQMLLGQKPQKTEFC
jgi:hypothetical protein